MEAVLGEGTEGVPPRAREERVEGALEGGEAREGPTGGVELTEGRRPTHRGTSDGGGALVRQCQKTAACDGTN